MDIENLSLKVLFEKLTIKEWLQIIGFLSTTILISFKVGYKWSNIKSEKRLNDIVNQEMKKPKIEIKVHEGNYSVSKLSSLFKYSFEGEPYIHPLIILDLLSWLSDGGATNIAIDIEAAMVSNKYYDEVEVKNRYISSKTKENGNFTYEYIGKSDNGVHILKTYDNSGGGSGIFTNLLFIVFGQDEVFEETRKKERFYVKVIGNYGLGDRYLGEVKLINNQVVISEDRSYLPYHKIEKEIRINV